MGDILIGKGDDHIFLQGRYGNRHGLVAGATGTGKSVSLLVMAEGFSRLGVPVVVGDAKGDIAGIAMPGTENERITQRLAADRHHRLAAGGQSRGLLGPVGRAGPPGAHDGHRDGADAAGAHPRAERHAGGRAQRRLPGGRRGGPAAARHEGPARAAQPRRGAGRTSARATAWSTRPASAPSSAHCCASKPRAASSSSASPASSSPT
jgi:hypothetical protein